MSSSFRDHVSSPIPDAPREAGGPGGHWPAVGGGWATPAPSNVQADSAAPGFGPPSRSTPALSSALFAGLYEPAPSPAAAPPEHWLAPRAALGGRIPQYGDISDLDVGPLVAAIRALDWPAELDEGQRDAALLPLRHTNFWKSHLVSGEPDLRWPLPRFGTLGNQPRLTVHASLLSPTFTSSASPTISSSGESADSAGSSASQTTTDNLSGGIEGGGVKVGGSRTTGETRGSQRGSSSRESWTRGAAETVAFEALIAWTIELDLSRQDRQLAGALDRLSIARPSPPARQTATAVSSTILSFPKYLCRRVP